MPGRLEATRPPFPFPGRLMGIIEMPSVAKVSVPCALAFGVRLAELLTPFPNS
jgi:hypothetical protein